MSSPIKKRMQSALVVRTNKIDESALVESQIELAHETSTTKLVNQYKRVMEDLKRDNQILRTENETLK
jgi:hypothetical protein